jgi:NAD(P)-dependent dehydrogenase (short-subunit alcohol dehydrogenase family)
VSDRGFDDQVALVTGGASGIGRATAQLLTTLGARVVLVDIDDERGREAAATLDATYLHCDVGSTEEWRATVARVVDELGSLDIAILNAGVRCPVREIDELTDELIEGVTRVNLGGVLGGIRACAPAMSRGGSMVATASVASFHPVEVDPIYAMTKHAVMGICRSLAPQLAVRGITLNMTCPNFVDTPLLRGNTEFMATLEKEGTALLDPAVIAHAAVALILSGGTGQAVICNPGAVPVRWTFQVV